MSADNIIKCPRCQGKKKIRGMGLIMKQCDKCNGVGWVSDVPHRTLEVESIVPTIKKRTRRSKQIDMVEAK